MFDDDTCYRAFTSRDRRFDGRFVTAVLTTGIYCRPGCPARRPARRNVRFFACPAAAESAGFRPCLRCRPETAPGSPAWSGTSATVARALRLIDDGALDGSGVVGLAARLGVTARWLRRLFAAQLGASPLAVARTRRVHFARRLLDETDLPIADVALAAGFGSARRLHDAIRATFRRAPRELRRRPAGPRPGRAALERERIASATAHRAAGSDALDLRLPARAPFDAGPLLRFFAARALPGVEEVADGVYRRSVQLDDESGVVEIHAVPGEAGVHVRWPASSSRSLLALASRTGRLFDLGADVGAIRTHLRGDPALAAAIPPAGIRVPGAWDPFELGVRALLGQQISVAAARTLATRLVGLCGTPLPGGPQGTLTHLFPLPGAVADADLSRVGLTRARAVALRTFATTVASGELDLTVSASLDEQVARLTALPGIGAWTAHYLAMRALGDPDAFPAGDLGLRRALGRAGRLATPGEVTERAERWRPWRAYAVIALWMKDAAGPTPRRRR
jgi:AraC family transcriptional regulator, regulatory protein of adaptative response / DNA-3-methyladenine glycosylase II